MLRQPVGLALRQPRVGFHQAPGHAVRRVVALEVHLAAVQGLDLVHPLGVALGRLGRARGGQAKAFKVDQPADALRPHAAIHHDHVAAHAVADQIDRLFAREVVEQGIEVGQVVGEPVAVGLRITTACQSEAPPVGRDDPAIGLQRVHHELP
ncbi:hypothetical protein D9M68_815300 [compost metagenome]